VIGLGPVLVILNRRRHRSTKTSLSKPSTSWSGKL